MTFGGDFDNGPDAWDASIDDPSPDDLDDFETQDALDMEGAVDDKAARDVDPPMDRSQDAPSYAQVTQELKDGTRALPLPAAVPSRDPGMAKVAAREWIEASRSIVHGPGPELRPMPARMRRRGVCAVLIICVDGTKRLLR